LRKARRAKQSQLAKRGQNKPKQNEAAQNEADAQNKAMGEKLSEFNEAPLCGVIARSLARVLRSLEGGPRKTKPTEKTQ